MMAYKEILDVCQNSLLNCTMAIVQNISYKSIIQEVVIEYFWARHRHGH